MTRLADKTYAVLERGFDGRGKNPITVIVSILLPVGNPLKGKC